VRAGRVATGETITVRPEEASKLKMARRDPSLKISKAERPVGKRPASPRMEFSGGLERARAPVSPSEDFGAKP
jgi:hypothetical protein